MGYGGPCVGSITDVVFMARNPHSFTGSHSHMQRARMGCGRCCSSGPLLLSVWSSDNHQNQKQSALTGAALILSWSPRKPDATHSTSLSLTPASQTHLCVPRAPGCQPVAGASGCPASLRISQGLWMVPCVTQCASSPNSFLTPLCQPTLVSSIAWFPM